MALRLLTVSMHKFLIWSFWAFCCCLAPKTVSQYAPKTDSTRPTITPQKNSLLRTVTIHMGVNPDNRPHPHTWGFNLPLAKSKRTGRLGVVSRIEPGAERGWPVQRTSMLI